MRPRLKTSDIDKPVVLVRDARVRSASLSSLTVRAT
jgi:hypothetical protein